MKVSYARQIQSVARLVTLAATLLMGAQDADALRAEGLSLDNSPPAAISPAAAADRPAISHTAVTAPAVPQVYPDGSLSDLFSRGGSFGGFAAGFLGCGLLGLLFDRGLFGGLDGTPSYFGLLLQLALVAMLCRLIWSRWRGERAPRSAALSPRQLADAYLRSRKYRQLDIKLPPPGADVKEAGTIPPTRRANKISANPPRSERD